MCPHLLVVQVHNDYLGIGDAGNVSQVAGPGGREVTLALCQIQKAARQKRVKIGHSCPLPDTAGSKTEKG